MYDVTVISTGNELINGTTTDTNSGYISFRFFATNFRIKRIIVVGDSLPDLENVLRESLSSDFIFITGGLGPTDDDNTIEALRNIAGFTIVQHRDSEKKMKKAFRSFDREVSTSDLKMAAVPEGSHVFENSTGLAPGFLLDHGSCRIIAMPGVPVEMAAMFDNRVIPYLSEKGFLKEGQHLVFRTVGIKETEANARLDSLGITGSGIEWGLTSKNGIITVTLIERSGKLKVGSLKEKITLLFGNDLLDFHYEKPEEELIGLLKKENSTIAVAESCTGGLISKRITDIPGSSAVFTGSVIAYSNRIKHDLLNVSETTLKARGAVSEETAGEMAKGVQEEYGSTYGISVTGIAGPDGGTDEKPVGTVCFGFALHDELVTVTRNFSGNRKRIRHFSSHYAIDYMRRYLLDKDLH